MQTLVGCFCVLSGLLCAGSFTCAAVCSVPVMRSMRGQEGWGSRNKVRKWFWMQWTLDSHADPITYLNECNI